MSELPKVVESWMWKDWPSKLRRVEEFFMLKRLTERTSSRYGRSSTSSRFRTLGNIFGLRGNEERMYSNIYCPEGLQRGYQRLQKLVFWEEGTLCSEIEDFVPWGTFLISGEMKSQCIQIYIARNVLNMAINGLLRNWKDCILWRTFSLSGEMKSNCICM